ncbi:MAG: hypothetical protein AAF810_24175 [Cyanobacteria bacterium P01_D01_bin.36]
MMKSSLKIKRIFLASAGVLGSLMLSPAFAQLSQPGLSLRNIVQFYGGLPQQDRAISLLQQQIDKSHPELLQADSIAANVWRNSATLIGHEDILSGISESDRIGTDPLDMAMSVANVRTGAPVEIEALYGPGVEAPSQAMITITEGGLLDDSVAGFRYRFDINNQAGQWVIARAGRQFRCQPGRGQQDWSAELCS